MEPYALRIESHEPKMFQELCFGFAASTLISTFGQFISEYWFFYIITLLILFQAGLIFFAPLKHQGFTVDKDEDVFSVGEKHRFFSRKTLKIKKDTAGVLEKIKKRIQDCKSPLVKRRAHTME